MVRMLVAVWATAGSSAALRDRAHCTHQQQQRASVPLRVQTSRKLHLRTPAGEQHSTAVQHTAKVGPRTSGWIAARLMPLQTCSIVIHCRLCAHSLSLLQLADRSCRHSSGAPWLATNPPRQLQ
jgi:hypothetical protein